jgi:hypothetical protein
MHPNQSSLSVWKWINRWRGTAVLLSAKATTTNTIQTFDLRLRQPTQPAGHTPAVRQHLLPVRAVHRALTFPVMASSHLCSTSLTLTHPDTVWGETIGVVGSWSGWVARQPLVADPASFPDWSTSIPDLSAGKLYEYKYIVLTNGALSRWEDLGADINRSFVAAPGLKIHDGKFGAPADTSSSIAVDSEAASGGATATTSSRLESTDTSPAADDDANKPRAVNVSRSPREAEKEGEPGGPNGLDEPWAVEEMSSYLRDELSVASADLQATRALLATARADPQPIGPISHASQNPPDPDTLSTTEALALVRGCLDQSSLTLDDVRASLFRVRTSAQKCRLNDDDTHPNRMFGVCLMVGGAVGAVVIGLLAGNAGFLVYS